MKQITKYLSTKVNKIDFFPSEPDHDKIINFLNSHGFDEAKGEDFSISDYMMIYSKNYNHPFYIDSKTAIYFTKGGTITKENPIFYCNLKLSNWITVNYSEIFAGITSQEKDKIYKTYSDFRDRVIKFFGW